MVYFLEKMDVLEHKELVHGVQQWYCNAI